MLGHRPTGRRELGSGSLPLARDIASASTHPWNAGWEYEDDFAYHGVLYTLVLMPTATDEMVSLLAQFKRALEKGSDARYDVVKAIVDRDAVTFETAMGTFLDQEQERRDEDRDAAGLREDGIYFWPRANVSVEALALLKAGEIVSLSLAKELPLCPRLARLPWSGQALRDPFEELEKAYP